MGVVQRQGIKNTIIIYTGIVIGFISLLIVQPAFLSKSEIGLTRLLLAFSSLFSSVFSISISNITIRYFPHFKNPENKHNGYFGFILLFPLAGSIIGCTLLYLFKDFLILHYSKDSKIFSEYFYYTFLLSFFITLILAFNSYCGGLLKTTVPSFLNDIFTRVLFIVLILLYAFGLLSFHQFIISFILSYGVQAILTFAYIWYYGHPGLSINWGRVREIGFSKIIRYGLVLTVTAITSVSLKFIDMIMIGHYKGEENVGVYSIAAFIATIIETPLNSLERIAHSKIAHFYAGNNLKEIKDIYFKSSRYLMLIGGLLTVLVIINVKDVLGLLPNNYTSGIGVTIVISLGAFINMATGVNYPIIFNSGKYYWGSIFVFILLVSSVILNSFLIPVCGIMGAAIATGISSVIYNLLKYFYIWYQFKMQPFDQKSLLIFVLIMISFGINYLLPQLTNPYLNIVLHSACISGLYLISTYCLKIVPEFHQYIPFIGKKHK